METTFTIWQTGRGLFKNFLDNPLGEIKLIDF